MKRFTKIMVLLLCLVLAFPGFAETTENETVNLFVPEKFAQMYNEMADALVDQYYKNLGEETVSQIKTDCLFAGEDGDGQDMILNSATGAVYARFHFENDSIATGDPAGEWVFCISRYLQGEAINLAAYTLKMMIAYTYRDTVSLGALSDWFNKLADPEDGFGLPGCTLSLAVTEDWIEYHVTPAADAKSGQQAGIADEEILFMNLPWGCDMESARLLLKASGLLTEEADGRFEMARRLLTIQQAGGASKTSYTCFRKDGDIYTAENGGGASNVAEVTLMSGMVNAYLGREVHHITLLFLVEGKTQKLLNVNVALMPGSGDVLTELTAKYGSPLMQDEGEYPSGFWFGENETGLCWMGTILNYGLLNAEALIQGK